MAVSSQFTRLVIFLIVFLILLSNLVETASYKNFIVVSPAGHDSPSCLNYTSLERSSNDPCETIDYVFSSNHHNGTKVVLESGIYNLTKNASFEGIMDFGISGNESMDNVEIVCFPDVGLTFLRSRNIRIQNVTIKGCGTLHHSSIGKAFAKYHKNHTLFYTGVFIAYCKNIIIQSCQISDSIGIGLTMYDTGGGVIIQDSKFLRNTPEISTSFAKENNYALAGGGVYLELTFDGALPPFDIHNPERFAYQNDSSYLIEKCTFKDNMAPGQYFNGTFIDTPEGTDHMPFGRGGGMSIFMKGHATNNNVTLHGNDFINNTALWGGGFFIEFQDQTQNNHVVISGSRFIKNNATTEGGGVRSGIIIWKGRFIANTIKQLNNVYSGNVAILSGAVSHYGPHYSLVDGEEKIREVLFRNCIFENNKATLGSALGFSTGFFDLRLNSLNLKAKFPWKAVFEDVTIVGNRNILTEDRKVIGQGALFASGITVELRRGALFEKNSDTALLLDNALLTVQDLNIFSNNTGFQGGAIGLYGLSIINLMPGSTLKFIGNQASEKGGAIYVAANGPPVLAFQSTELNERSCFLAYNYSDDVENIDDWKTSIIFSLNTAKGGGNSVYVHSLQSCRQPGEQRKNNNAMQWPGIIEYKDRIHDDGFDIRDEVATEPLEIVVHDHQWHVAPGEEFSAAVELRDEKDGLVKGIVQVSVGIAEVGHQDNIPTPPKLLLVNPQNKSSSLVSNLTIKGNDKVREFELILTTLGGQIIKTRIPNLTLKDCYMGFKLDPDTRECTCRSKLRGVSHCSTDRKHVNLKNGYWGGMEGECFSTYPCPNGYCSNYVTRITSTGDYRMIPGKMCSENRDQTSVLCGKCKHDCSVLIGSEKCRSDCSYRTLYWFVPVFCIGSTFVVLIVLVLDLDIFTVYLNAVLYFYQVIPYLISQYNEAFFQHDGFITFVIGLANWRINITSESYICVKNMTGLNKIAMEYSFPGFIFLVLLIVRLTGLNNRLSRFSDRLRCLRHVRRENRGEQSYNATHALCNLLVLCYTDVILTSFKIVHYVDLSGNWVQFYDGSIEFYKDWRRHFIATGVAILLLFLALVLAIILIIVPQFCHKIPGYQRFRLFFDLFQSCFEEILEQDGSRSNRPSTDTSSQAPSVATQSITVRSNRWFAGFYLLCRFVIFLLAFYVPFGPLRRSILEISCVVVASVCLLVKPYNSKYNWLNISDAILLFTLCVIAILSTAVNHDVEYGDKLRITVHALTYVPLIYLLYLIYLCWRACRSYYQESLHGHQRLQSSDYVNVSTVSTSNVSSDHHNSQGGDQGLSSPSQSLTKSYTV